MNFNRRQLMKRGAAGLRIVILCVLIAACGGPLETARSVWAGTKPVIASLVVTGQISQQKADTVTRDVDDTLVAGDRAEQCVKVITVTGDAKKVQKGKCIFQFAVDFKAILARHNFLHDPTLVKIELIGRALIAALENYYNRVTGKISATLNRSGEAIDPDKQLEIDVKAAEKQLKELKAQH